jgi:hypothetical protein
MIKLECAHINPHNLLWTENVGHGNSARKKSKNAYTPKKEKHIPPAIHTPQAF